MKTMAWDVDDVLNDLLRAWFDQAWRPRDPTCAISYEQLTENPPHAILGTTIDDYRRSLDAFRLSDAGANLPPNPLLVEWFRTFGPRAPPGDRAVPLRRLTVCRVGHAALRPVDSDVPRRSHPAG